MDINTINPSRRLGFIVFGAGNAVVDDCGSRTVFADSLTILKVSPAKTPRACALERFTTEVININKRHTRGVASGMPFVVSNLKF